MRYPQIAHKIFLYKSMIVYKSSILKWDSNNLSIYNFVNMCIIWDIIYCVCDTFYYRKKVIMYANSNSFYSTFFSINS